eukprot:tig00000760_g3927.t1
MVAAPPPADAKPKTDTCCRPCARPLFPEQASLLLSRPVQSLTIFLGCLAVLDSYVALAAAAIGVTLFGAYAHLFDIHFSHDGAMESKFEEAIEDLIEDVPAPKPGSWLRRALTFWHDVVDGEERIELHTRDEVPDAIKVPFVLGGYRFGLSPAACLRSVAFLHNQTVNIYTHGLPCLYLLFLAYRSASHPDLAPYDASVLTLYCLLEVACLASSSVFHTFACHSECCYFALNRWDCNGILSASLGGILSVMLLGFRDSPRMILLHSTIFFPMYFAIVATGQGHAYRDPKRNLARTVLYGGVFLYLIPLLVHQRLWHLPGGMPLPFSWDGIAALFLGALLYATRVPERFAPGAFDLVGMSHNLWHVCVAYEMIRQHQACLAFLEAAARAGAGAAAAAGPGPAPLPFFS